MKTPRALKTLKFRVLRLFHPQVRIVRRNGLNWVVLTRRNGFTRKWTVREEIRNKKAAAAVRHAIALYPGHFLYVPKKAVKEFRKRNSR